jgi:hypothetical protein
VNEGEWKRRYNNLEAILKERKVERTNGMRKQIREVQESKEKKRKILRN